MFSLITRVTTAVEKHVKLPPLAREEGRYSIAGSVLCNNKGCEFSNILNNNIRTAINLIQYSNREVTHTSSKEGP